MITRISSLTRHRGHVLRPFILLALLAVLFALLPAFKSGAAVGTVNITNILQTFASVGLVTLGLALTMIAGEFDLSVSSTFLLGGMLAVKTGVHSPLLGVLVAVAVGLLIGFMQGVLITKLKLNSMSVTLGGLIAVLGLVYVLSNSQSVGYSNSGAGIRLDQSILSVFSIRIFIAIALYLVIGVMFSRSTVGRDLRAIGSDRNASRVAGVRISWLVIGVFTLSGVLATFAGALQSYSLDYAAPSTSVAPLIFATTAALLGGVPLSGGRGNPFGIAAGVLSLGIVTEAIPILHGAQYVTSLIPAVLLLIVVIVDAPDKLRWWKVLQSRRSSGPVSGPEADTPASPGEQTMNTPKGVI